MHSKLRFFVFELCVSSKLLKIENLRDELSEFFPYHLMYKSYHDGFWFSYQDLLNK